MDTRQAYRAWIGCQTGRLGIWRLLYTTTRVYSMVDLKFKIVRFLVGIVFRCPGGRDVWLPSFARLHETTLREKAVPVHSVEYSKLLFKRASSLRHGEEASSAYS